MAGVEMAPVGTPVNDDAPESLDPDREHLYVSSNSSDDDDTDVGDTFTQSRTWREKALAVLRAAGPGIVVMLADTDASCIITAADSGKQWGYSLVLMQILLIPPLYMAQELTVRIAAVHRRGLGAIARDSFGPRWGLFLVGVLLVTCVGGLVSEFVSVAGAFEIYHVPKYASAGVLLLTMATVVLTGSYKRVELLAGIMGLAECAFFVTMIMSKPGASEFAEGLGTFPVQHNGYLLLFSANIGAVIMPWMIFYQCSAIAAKGLRVRQITAEKVDTAIGACLTQLIMVAVVVTTAATAWNGKYDGSSPAFESVPAISQALTSVLGKVAGEVLFVLGLTGGAMIGCVVVSLTGAWALTEALQLKNSLDSSPREAPLFYVLYMLLLVVAYLVAISGVNIVTLNIVVQTMNTLLLPVVLVFLVAVARKLPEAHALRGRWLALYSGLFGVIAVIGLVTGFIGLTTL